MGSKLSIAYWEQNPDALLVLSPEGLVLEWNPAAELIFGYKQADVQGLSLLDLIVPKDRAHEEEALRAEAVRLGTSVESFEQDDSAVDVLRGIDAARAAGLAPIKVNMVVKRGTNDHEILPMARHFKGTGIVLRFIEYMDVGATNGWRMDEVLPSAEVVQRIHAELPLVQLDPSAPGETAERWGYADGSGEIGVISSVTQAFCGDCSRARLSTEGQLYLCLFASQGHDLRALLRGDYDDAQVGAAIGAIWSGRDDRYSELRAALPPDLGPLRLRIAGLERDGRVIAGTGVHGTHQHKPIHHGCLQRHVPRHGNRKSRGCRSRPQSSCCACIIDFGDGRTSI